MTRTNQSTTTTKVDVANHLGYNVTFRYEIATGKTNPTSVFANATEVVENGVQPQVFSVNADVNGPNTNKKSTVVIPEGLELAIANECMALIEGE